VIYLKVRGLFTKTQGATRETNGCRVDSRKPEGFLNKISMRTGIRVPRMLDHGSTTDIRSAGERAGAGGRARLTGGLGVG
jgi:hypothetical protein